MAAPWNFARFLPLAERVLSRGRLPALLFAVARKGPKLDKLRDDLRLMQSLCLAWWRNEYRGVPKKTLLLIVAGLLYFVSPFDAIPDWIPGVGFLDDIAVLTWVMKTVSEELERFKQWRDRQPVAQLRDIEQLPQDPETLKNERERP